MAAAVGVAVVDLVVAAATAGDSAVLVEEAPVVAALLAVGRLILSNRRRTLA